MSRSFDVQINARRIKFVKSCINVIIITLFYTLYTWFGKNQLRLYLNGAKKIKERKYFENDTSTPFQTKYMDYIADVASVYVQVLSQVLHEMQPELPKKRWKPARHAPISGKSFIHSFIH